MCGITGFLDRSAGIGADSARAAIEAMTATLVHRGPDGAGYWSDIRRGVAFGFRRLAIIDLSSYGDQPMVSANGRFVLIFNGEIYNFLDLRQELESRGHRFRGHSDTEVILSAIVEWGPEPAITRLSGMFACALWDTAKCELLLFRDRLGIKPLYYGQCGSHFIFGSELKAVQRHPEFSSALNQAALDHFIQFGYVGAPATIYQDFFKLPPGCLLRVRPGTDVPRIESYWRLEEIYERTRGAGATATELTEELDQLLRVAVRRHMVADVPLGVLLSGGFDSSTVAALMQAQSDRPVRTFSIGFNEPGFDEGAYARRIARHLGTEHTELYLQPRQALDLIPSLSQIYDEPFADSSQIPTVLVSRMARTSVTVALSGDGGDELFGGYNRYIRGSAMWRGTRRIPAAIRLQLARLFQHQSGISQQLIQAALWPWLRHYGSSGSRREKLDKVARVLLAASPDEIYRRLCSLGSNTAQLLGHSEASSPAYPASGPGLSVAGRMAFLDLLTYLPDDILAKVDRASMSASLEVRVPLLDDAVVRFAALLPDGYKVRGQTGKWLLRRVAYRYIPRRLLDRPKAGFAMPLNAWLRGPLRPWVEDLLRSDPGLLHHQAALELWQNCLQGRAQTQQELWAILMLYAWHRDRASAIQSQPARAINAGQPT